MARTVITLPGAFALGYDTKSFGGALFKSPNTRIASPPGGWNNFGISNSAATSDMNNLDTLMKDTLLATADRPLIVAGHSRGAQVIYKWLREKGPSSTINPAHVLFISSGNPERKYNGAGKVRPEKFPGVYPGGTYGVGLGLPTSPTPYTVIDIARQYDQWADYPNVFTKAAVSNMTIRSNTIHLDYSKTPPIDANGGYVAAQWAVFTEGNVKYLTCPTFPAPQATAVMNDSWDRGLALWQKAFGGVFLPAFKALYVKQEAKLARLNIESAYTRPAPLPAV